MSYRVTGYSPRQIGHLIVTPFATIGVLSAVLVWEIEHVGSLVLALAIFAGAVVVGIVVAKRLRVDIEDLANHYKALLNTADDQSRRAEAANRLKDEFLATLSHELRTPLNSVLGWARLLASGKLDAKQTTRAIESIERAGWAQSRLIEDLLDISQIVGGKLQISPRPTEVQPLAETAVDSLRAAADAKNITLDLSLDPAIEPIDVDRDRLQQVVWNLVSNAIKFTPMGGRVEVRLWAEHGQLCLSVHDNGVGFDPTVAAHLFERFRQGDSSSTRQYGGLGLGLGIVRHVVELHGGTVSASSAGNDTGSTFVVRLPMRQSGAAPIKEKVAASPPSLHGVSVLVVDDDPQALDFARTTLEQYGARVVTASSAREGRDRFNRQPPDVLLSDLVMAQDDGLQFIRDIRIMDHAAGRVTPAAALTALARTDDRRRALDAGYQMHMSKPVDPDELAVTVERLAHHSLPQPVLEH
jgi:signal transduction histidine kinase/ActR/RegA family two-component response regulator